VILVEFLFLIFSSVCQAVTTPLSLILFQDLQLSALLYLNAGQKEKFIFLPLSPFAPFYDLTLLFNAPCSFDRKVIG